MKYVYTYGAFDLLHPGHVSFLQRAAQLGDMLLVGVVSDKAVRELKGNGRPIQSQEDRMTLVNAIEGVFEVYEQNTYNPIEMLKMINETMIGIHESSSSIILTKGDDWDFIPGKDWAEENRIEYTSLSYSDKWSTSATIKKIQEPDMVVCQFCKLEGVRVKY